MCECIFFLALCAQPAQKLPVPPAEAVRKSLEIVREVYEQDFTTTHTPEQKGQLARRVLDEARRTTDNQANRFALLLVSMELAAAAGDLSTLADSMETIHAEYMADLGDLVGRIQDKPQRASLSRGAVRSYAERVVRLARAAVLENAYDSAHALMDSTLRLARQSGAPGLVQDLATRLARIRELQAAWEELQASIDQLEQDAVDPRANQAVGEFECFSKNNWAIGLPYLLLGEDQMLRRLAEASLKDSLTTSERLAVADRWWELADEKGEQERENIHKYAAAFYKAVVGELSGLTHSRVRKRLSDTSHLEVLDRVPVAPRGVIAFQHEGVIDCANSSHRLAAQSGFDLRKSWVLELEFWLRRVPQQEYGWILFWGDERIGFDPLLVGFINRKFLTAADNCGNASRTYVFPPGQRVPINRWVRLALAYDENKNSLALYLDGELESEAACASPPFADRDMPVCLGSNEVNQARANVKVRNLQLAN